MVNCRECFQDCNNAGLNMVVDCMRFMGSGSSPVHSQVSKDGFLGCEVDVKNLGVECEHIYGFWTDGYTTEILYDIEDWHKEADTVTLFKICPLCGVSF